MWCVPSGRLGIEVEGLRRMIAQCSVGADPHHTWSLLFSSGSGWWCAGSSPVLQPPPPAPALVPCTRSWSGYSAEEHNLGVIVVLILFFIPKEKKE